VVNFRRLDSPSDPACFDFLACYREAIPPCERKTDETITSLIARPDYVFLLLEHQSKCKGFCILVRPLSQPVLLLEYMGIQEVERGRGWGSDLFLSGLELARMTFGDLPCLVEVDSPSQATPDRTQRERRIRFYRNLGCRQIANLQYLLPLDTAGPPPAMDLLVQTSAKMIAVPHATLRGWLEALYRDVYGFLQDDPRITSMLSGLPDPVPLR